MANRKITVPLNLDFELLRDQKRKLVSVQMNLPGLTMEESEAIDGIVNIIDFIQDFAVDKAGIPESEVFFTEPETDNP